MLLGLWTHYFFGITIFLTSLFLILLVLVQRGRGGGIAGALGGAGGQSAFGTRAGDLFTRITVAVATVWILLCCLAILTLKSQSFTTGVTKSDPKAGSIGVLGETALPPTSPAADTAEPPPPPTPSAAAETAETETETEPEADSEPNTPTATEPDESGPPSATSQPEGAEASSDVAAEQPTAASGADQQ